MEAVHDFVLFDVGVSLDGYIAGPNRGPQNPLGDGGVGMHAWAFQTATFRDRLGVGGGDRSHDDGDGLRLMDGLSPEKLKFEQTESSSSPLVTHINYRVTRWTRNPLSTLPSAESNIQIPHELRVLLDEVSPRLHLVAHEHLEDPVRLDCILDVHLEQRAHVRIHRRLP